MKISLIVLGVSMLLSSHALWAQDAGQEEVKTVIRQLFDGMRKGDSAAIRAVMGDKVIMQTIVDKKDGNFILADGSLEGFLKAVGTPHTDVWDERIEFGQVLIDANLASVWTPYRFFLGSKFSHCGVNSFQLFKSATGWKIVYLVDTRRKDCAWLK